MTNRPSFGDRVMRKLLSLLVFGTLLTMTGGNAIGQDKEKDYTKAAQKVMIPAKAKGELIGYYFKSGGIVNGAFLNNPRYCVLGPKFTLVSATLDGKKLRVEFSVDEDGQGVQALNLDNGVAKVGFKAAGKAEFEETKITAADQTENFDKGTLVLIFEDYTALHKAVPKKK